MKKTGGKQERSPPAAPYCRSVAIIGTVGVPPFAAAGVAARRGFASLHLVRFVVVFGRGVLLWLLLHRDALSATAAGAASQKIKKIKITLRQSSAAIPLLAIKKSAKLGEKRRVVKLGVGGGIPKIKITCRAGRIKKSFKIIKYVEFSRYRHNLVKWLLRWRKIGCPQGFFSD